MKICIDPHNTGCMKPIGRHNSYCDDCHRKWNKEYQWEKMRDPEYKSLLYNRTKTRQDERNKTRLKQQKEKDLIYGSGVYVLSNGILKPGKFSKGNKTNRLASQKTKRGDPVFIKCYLSENESERLERVILHALAPWKLHGTRADLFIDCEDSRNAIKHYFDCDEIPETTFINNSPKQMELAL